MCRDLPPFTHAGLFLHLHNFLESESGAVVFNSWVVTRWGLQEGLHYGEEKCDKMNLLNYAV